MAENSQDSLDVLQLAKDKTIQKSLSQGEVVLLSAPVYKFNDYKKRQERNILLTNKSFYNIKGNTIKRKIEIQKIKAITIGPQGSEFVLHVPEEYDYRYSSQDKREKILLVLIDALVKATNQKITVFFRDDVCLYNYATTKDDKKAKINKMPIDGGKLFDRDSFEEWVDGGKKQSQDFKSRTTTLWSKDKTREVTIEDFTMLKVLGAGAFGTVFLVEDKLDKEWYAMKMIKKDVIIKKGQFEHTKTEKMILEHVNHPNLVSLVFAFQDPTRLFFVMQFMKGGELFQHLKLAKKFEEKRAKFYTAQLALALGHLHSQDIVYRDLKLENILMDQLGNVYLTDFGMAKTLKPEEIAMTFCGTPEYLSPEVIRGLGCDKTTDWWSLGILTYEMMYGLPPFYNKTQAVMFKLIKDGELRFPEKPVVSKEGQDFIIKCLNRDKSKRMGSQSDVLEVFQHPWFKDIDFQKLEKKQIPPPFTPKVTDEEWIDNFDKDFTKIDPRIDPSAPQSNDKKHAYEDEFKNF